MINYILLVLLTMLFVRISRLEKKLKEDIRHSKDVVQAHITSNRFCLREEINLNAESIKYKIENSEKNLSEGISNITSDVEDTIKGEIVKLAFTPIEITKYKKY
ncbi:MAG: hypothetical protein RR620_10875 [Clostridium sp.]